MRSINGIQAWPCVSSPAHLLVCFLCDMVPGNIKHSLGTPFPYILAHLVLLLVLPLPSFADNTP